MVKRPAPLTPFAVCCNYVEIWRRGVELEAARLRRHADKFFRERAGFVDAHLFAVALRNLLRAADEAAKSAPDRLVRRRLRAAINKFKTEVVGVTNLRNAAEHFEGHLSQVRQARRGDVGKPLGRRFRVERLGRRKSQTVTIFADDVEIDVATARRGALRLADFVLALAPPKRTPYEEALPITPVLGSQRPAE